MIQANELRIGNWVIGSYGGFTKEVEIYDMDRSGIQHSNEYTNTLPYKYFSPIPLTEEWLLKFGFESGNDNGYTTDFFINGKITVVNGIDDKGDDYYIEDKTGIHISHLHQLQNLYFALTGTELTLTP